jgi:hypothetical protein
MHKPWTQLREHSPRARRVTDLDAQQPFLYRATVAGSGKNVELRIHVHQSRQTVVKIKANSGRCHAATRAALPIHRQVQGRQLHAEAPAQIVFPRWRDQTLAGPGSRCRPSCESRCSTTSIRTQAARRKAMLDQYAASLCRGLTAPVRTATEVCLVASGRCKWLLGRSFGRLALAPG